MRIVPPIFAGSIAVLAVLATPALASSSAQNSHANPQQVGETPATPSCYAYQQAPDGQWVQLACHEGGMAAPTPPHAKSASHHTGDETTPR